MNGNDYGESAYRKFYAAFEQGRKYERGVAPTVASTRILSISDSHVPFQKPVTTFSKYAGKIDILQLNGDIIDCASISKFSKAHRSSAMEEIIVGRQYLIDLIELLKPKKVIVTYGNHDIRFENYLAKNIDSDLTELMPRTSLEYIIEDGFVHYNKATHAKTKYEPLKDIFEPRGIEIEYTHEWFCQIGKTIFCHPKAYSTAPLKTATTAMYFFRNEGMQFSSLVMAHTHRIGNYLIGNTTVFEQGAACETRQFNYHDGLLVNSQKEGYLYIEQDACGEILNYKQEILN